MAANKFKGEVEFEALDKKWTMRLGMNEAIELQEKLGLGEDAGPEELMKALTAMQTLKKLRSFFVTVLQFAHPDVDEKTVGLIVTEIGLLGGVRLVTEVLHWAMADADPEEANGGKRGKGGRPGATS